ncbi:MAG: 2-keto-4-pentenoate hydratase [Isosphaeraceae bacterium]
MRRDELADWACRVRDDRDALRPWRSFAPPDAMTAEEAYALQGEVARLREERGERIVGYKIGCTSQVIQDQLGIREPIFARLFQSEQVPDGARIDHSRFAHLAIEGELAIRLSRDLPSDPLSDEEYVEAVDAVFPVIEPHHHAPPARGFSLAALIVSGGMNAGLVVPSTERSREGQVPLVTELEVRIDDRLAGGTQRPWAMGGPALALRWLAARLAAWDLRLRKGQVILTGSPLPLFPVKPGSRIVVEARPLGTCSVVVG